MGQITQAKNFISKESLISTLTNIINDIRSTDKGYEELKKGVDELMTYSKRLSQARRDKSTSSILKNTFNVYKQIQKVSLELRKLLPEFINTADLYDSINYAIYYEGIRYEVHNLTLDMLRVGSKGQLEINLNKATKDIRQTAEDMYNDAKQELFSRHYNAYRLAIKGTYRGTTYKGLQGRIAEAYESHLQEHHDIKKEQLHPDKDTINIDTKILAFANHPSSAVTWWNKHESITEAWMHVHYAGGTQRGTVAGDVGRWQVKQGNKENPELKLASAKTLQDGISNYSAILNKKIPSNVVAAKIATYLSEPLYKVTKNFLESGALDKKIQNELQSANDNRANLRDSGITIAL